MTTPTTLQLIESHDRKVRRDRQARTISRAWAWLLAILLALILTLALIFAFRATLDSIMVAQRYAPMAAIAAQGW